MLPAAAVALLWALRLVAGDLSGSDSGLVLPDALSSEMQDLLGVGLTPAPTAQEDEDNQDEEAEPLPAPAPLTSPPDPGPGPGRRSGAPWAHSMVSPEDFDFMTVLRPPPPPPPAEKATAAPSKGRKQNKKGSKSNGKGGSGKRRKQSNKQSQKHTNKTSVSNVSHPPPSYSPGYSPGYVPSYSPGYVEGFSPSYGPMTYPPPLFSPNVYPPDFHPPHHPPHADPYANHLYEMGPGPMGDMFQSSIPPFLDANSEMDSYQKPSYSQPLFNQHSDQRPSGSSSVQLSQSVPAGEHHSTHTYGWLTNLQQTTTPPAPPPPPPPPPPVPSTTTLAPSISKAASKRATLRDILAQDCPGAEDVGYCDSPPRYPTQQVSEIIQKCSHLVDYMYAPLPEELNNETENNSVVDGSEACPSVRRVLRPGYVRDAVSGRWLVALQSRAPIGVEQRVAAELCGAPGRACARLAQSKCARNLGFRNGARATSCEQRTLLVPLLTWDPEAPSSCPRMRQARFPSACVCLLS